jgi:hypothetical protein
MLKQAVENSVGMLVSSPQTRLLWVLFVYAR